VSAWHFRDGQVDAATELVKRFHYSGRMVANTNFVATAHRAGGLFGDFGEAVAACVYREPSTRWSEPVWELVRLVRTDDADIALSSLVAWSLRVIRAARPACDLVVSFADATHGHHGGIYQACSWHYGGQREANMDGLVVNGVFVPGRSCNQRWGTRSPAKLAAMYPEWSVEPHYDTGKHLYWQPVRKSGRRKAARMGLRSLPYPKPDASTLERAA
jgi:hypothetical protein